MTRSEVAERAGVNRETVRYYEKRDLIPDPPRTSSGYRKYDEGYVQRIQFIERAQELGFTLEEIKELLVLRVDHETDCGAVKRQARAEIAEVEKKIRDLKRIKQALTRLTDSCSGRGPTSDCPILDAMENREAFSEAVS